jgi:hypothetical protein
VEALKTLANRFKGGHGDDRATRAGFSIDEKRSRPDLFPLSVARNLGDSAPIELSAVGGESFLECLLNKGINCTIVLPHLCAASLPIQDGGEDEIRLTLNELCKDS